MPAPQRRFAAAVPASNSLDPNVEAVVATSPPVSTSFPGCVFLIEFQVAYALGSDATALLFKVRQTAIGGLAAAPDWQISALDALSLDGVAAISAVDQRAIDAAGIVWVLTAKATDDSVQITGGTASVTIDVGGTPNVFA